MEEVHGVIVVLIVSVLNMIEMRVSSNKRHDISSEEVFGKDTFFRLKRTIVNVADGDGLEEGYGQPFQVCE